MKWQYQFCATDAFEHCYGDGWREATIKPEYSDQIHPDPSHIIYRGEEHELYNSLRYVSECLNACWQENAMEEIDTDQLATVFNGADQQTNDSGSGSDKDGTHCNSARVKTEETASCDNKLKDQKTTSNMNRQDWCLCL